MSQWTYVEPDIYLTSKHRDGSAKRLVWQAFDTNPPRGSEGEIDFDYKYLDNGDMIISCNRSGIRDREPRDDWSDIIAWFNRATLSLVNDFDIGGVLVLRWNNNEISHRWNGKEWASDFVYAPRLEDEQS